MRDQIGQQPIVPGTGSSDEIARGENQWERFADRRRSRLNGGEGIPRQFQTLPPRS